VGASPTPQPLQPQATGAGMEPMKWLKRASSEGWLDQRDQTCRGRHQKPRSLDSRLEGARAFEADRQTTVVRSRLEQGQLVSAVGPVGRRHIGLQGA
jgi:hypothetical protein